MIDLSELNPQQRKAVEATEGQVLILAGAGSGKTKTLMNRIAYIIDSGLAKEENILVVTFTNKAAGEMKERIARLVGEQIRIPWMGTFHSMCVKLLRREGQALGYERSFSIYDPSDQLDVVKRAMDALSISQKEVKPKAILNHISMAKNELLTPQDYAGFAQGYFQQIVAQVYPQYQQTLKTNNAMDFDDLIMNTVKLFEREPNVLARYQQQFRYVMVDEYQDTNHAQYRLIKMLAAGYENICCVGDDDQSIYAFRGATIRNILNFEKDYPDALVIKLEQNYRSTMKILSASHQVVSKNKNRKDKKLWTENSKGDAIKLYKAENEFDEGRWIARQISRLVDDGADPDDIAILYRTNAQSRALEEQMLREAIDYRVVGGIRFYDRKEIRDVLAYLRILHNEFDDGSLTRIINTPRRGIGNKTIQQLSDQAKLKSRSMVKLLIDHSDEITNAKLQTFAKLVVKLRQLSVKLNVVELINEVLSLTGYIDMLKDGTLENESRIENIKELVSVAAKFGALDPEDSLSEFLQEVALFEGASEDDNIGKVTLMTIHAAKGLEFANVFVAGMEEGLFPHSRVYSDPKELEEERRLAYVAITRAKVNLYLTHADSRTFFGKPQSNLLSRFVEDIEEELIEKRSYLLGDFAGGGLEEYVEPEVSGAVVDVDLGDRIRHDYFGIGIVQDLADGKAVINFGPVYGTKEIMLEFAPIRKV